MASLTCDRCGAPELSATATDLRAQPAHTEALCDSCARALVAEIQAEIEALDPTTPTYAHWRIVGMRPRWDDFREQVAETAQPAVELRRFAIFLANIQAHIAEPMPPDIAAFVRRYRDPPT